MDKLAHGKLDRMTNRIVEIEKVVKRLEAKILDLYSRTSDL